MSIILYLLPLGFIFDLFGYIPPSIRLFLIYSLLALPLALKPSKRNGWMAIALGAVIGVRAWLDWPPLAEIALLLITHQMIWANESVSRILRTATITYTIIYCWLFASPSGHAVLNALTSTGCKLAQNILGHPVLFGPSYLNLGGLLLFLTLSVFSWERNFKGPLKTAVFLVIATLLNAGSVALLLKYADFGASFSWELKYNEPFNLWTHLKGLTVIIYPGIVFLLQLTLYVILHHIQPQLNAAQGVAFYRRLHFGFVNPVLAPIPTTNKKKYGLALAILAGITVFLVTPPTWSISTPRNVVFLNKGLVSFTKPNHTSYGEHAGGMFGMFPEYANLFGCKSVVIKELPNTLDPSQILVITSPTADMGADARQRIWEFVEKGGSLWVLGDHTAIHDGRNYLNELLAPCHILFNNDSAQFFPQGWFNSYRIPQGTPFSKLKDETENRLGILVGASLEVSLPAQPFIMGRFGYADKGLNKPIGTQKYLGDFKFQPGKPQSEVKPEDTPADRIGEQLGDMVLVAGSQHGKGRVLVFGDTTSFFNNNTSKSYEVLRASLSWLCTSNKWAPATSIKGQGLIIILLGAFTGIAFCRRSSPIGMPTLLTIGAISFSSHIGAQLPYVEAIAKKKLALIDYSHLPNASKHGGATNALHGISINLQRHGALPITVAHWDTNLLKQAKYLIITAPRKTLTKQTCKELNLFMEKGGTTILSCGYFESDACKNLLSPLGITIGNNPLGRFFDREAFGSPISFMSAWPLGTSLPKNTTVLCTTPNNLPLIVKVPIGNGQLIVIADSEFLQNSNLEGSKNHDPANTKFLKNLLESIP